MCVYCRFSSYKSLLFARKEICTAQGGPRSSKSGKDQQGRELGGPHGRVKVWKHCKL